MYTGADTFEAFTQAADDAQAVINYVHNYEVPADPQGLRGAATMAAPPPSGGEGHDLKGSHRKPGSGAGSVGAHADNGRGRLRQCRQRPGSWR
jgi:hypothetical protein